MFFKCISKGCMKIANEDFHEYVKLRLQKEGLFASCLRCSFARGKEPPHVSGDGQATKRKVRNSWSKGLQVVTWTALCTMVSSWPFEEFTQSPKYNKCRECILFNFIQQYVAYIGFCVPSTKRWPDPFACTEHGQHTLLALGLSKRRANTFVLGFRFPQLLWWKEKHLRWLKSKVEVMRP